MIQYASQLFVKSCKISDLKIFLIFFAPDKNVYCVEFEKKSVEFLNIILWINFEQIQNEEILTYFFYFSI